MVNTDKFWENRLDKLVITHPEIHRVVCDIDKDIFVKSEQTHLDIIKTHLHNNDKILDVGCGYGRLYDLLKAFVDVDYIGVDSCHRFINIASLAHGDKPDCFYYGNAARTPFPARTFHVAICLGLRNLILGELGGNVWELIEEELKRVADKILVLEYENPEEYLLFSDMSKLEDIKINYFESDHTGLVKRCPRVWYKKRWVSSNV